MIGQISVGNMERYLAEYLLPLIFLKLRNRLLQVKTSLVCGGRHGCDSGNESPTRWKKVVWILPRHSSTACFYKFGGIGIIARFKTGHSRRSLRGFSISLVLVIGLFTFICLFFFIVRLLFLYFVLIPVRSRPSRCHGAQD